MHLTCKSLLSHKCFINDAPVCLLLSSIKCYTYCYKTPLKLNVLFIFIKLYCSITYDITIFILTWKRRTVICGSNIKMKGKITVLYDKFLCIYLSTVTARELGRKRDVKLMLKLKKSIFCNVKKCLLNLYHSRSSFDWEKYKMTVHTDLSSINWYK